MKVFSVNRVSCQAYLLGGTGSGLCGVGAETKLLVLRGRRRRRVGPGQTGPLLQSEELGLPLQSTLLSVLLQRGRVTLRGRNKPTVGSGGTGTGDQSKY